MLRRLAGTVTLIFLMTAPANTSTGELTIDTLNGVLKKIGLYNSNKLTINGQLYHIERVSVSSNRREFVIRFVANPTE